MAFGAIDGGSNPPGTTFPASDTASGKYVQRIRAQKARGFEPSRFESARDYFPNEVKMNSRTADPNQGAR